MDRQAIAEVVAKPYAQQLLGSSIPARLSYTGTDGGPRVVPIAFLWTGSAIVVCTLPKSAKVKALRNDPRVAITIDTEGYPPKALLLRGTASLEFVDGVPDEYVEGARKVVPTEQMAAWESGVRAMYGQMVRITVDLNWAKLLDFETTIPKAVEDLIRARESA
jgi:hypothetical protein